MSKRFSWIFLVASGVFFLFIIGLTGYRIETTRTRNVAQVRERSSLLSAKVLSLRDITGGWDAPQFKTDMHALFTAEPRLLMLCLHSSHDGILYFTCRGKSFLTNPETITASWRGTPAYRVARGYDVLISTSLRDGGGVTMDTLFVVMGREDLYPVVRDDLYLFLAFLLVCGVAILILMGVQQEPVRGAAQGPEGRVSAGPGERSEETARTDEGGTPRAESVSPEHLVSRLKSELERASSSDQDISVARLRMDGPSTDPKASLAHAGLARLLKDSYPLHDLIFDTGNLGYSIIMPDNDVDAAVRTLDKIRARIADTDVEGKKRTVSIGVSARGGRLIEEDVLLEEADIAVSKATREGGNQVIGFRADASRFRNALNENLT